MAEQKDKIESSDNSVTAVNSSEGEKDEELDALLNSALNDFDKPLSAKAVESTNENSASVNECTDEEAFDKFLEQQNFLEEFIKKAEQCELKMHDFLSSAEGRTVSEEAGGGDDGEVGAAISQTLKNLLEDADSLKANFSDDIASMFSNLGMGEGSEGGDFLPFMQQMMQSLLSKDILYPALKDIVDKYPTWLEENKSKLETTEYERFNKQKILMERVCGELEKESESDSQEAKKKRFETILDLMQKMQDCGQPPKDLVGDLGSVVSFDEQGNPCLPGLNQAGTDPMQQCSVM